MSRNIYIGHHWGQGFCYNHRKHRDVKKSKIITSFSLHVTPICSTFSKTSRKIKGTFHSTSSLASLLNLRCSKTPRLIICQISKHRDVSQNSIHYDVSAFARYRRKPINLFCVQVVTSRQNIMSKALKSRKTPTYQRKYFHSHLIT